MVADNGQRLVTMSGEVKNEFCNDFQHVMLVYRDHEFFECPLSSIWQLVPVSPDTNTPNFHVVMPHYEPQNQPRLISYEKSLSQYSTLISTLNHDMGYLEEDRSIWTIQHFKKPRNSTSSLTASHSIYNDMSLDDYPEDIQDSP